MISIYELLRRNQDDTSKYVQEKLTSLNIPFSVDSYGNIYNLDYENSAVLSAHMDTVRKDADICMGAFLTENDEPKIFTGGILGGDDKCGVYIMLKVLESGRKVNFIFSRDEEIGCKGIGAFVTDTTCEEKLKKCLYGLILDRRGNTDIICNNNNYGTKEFEDNLVEIANAKIIHDDNNGTLVEKPKFNYKPTSGLVSDANTICKYISCANLSVGYWSPHSAKEYIVKDDLETAYNYVLDILDNIKVHFDAPEERNWAYYKYGSCKTDHSDCYNYGYKSNVSKTYSGKSYYDDYDEYWDYNNGWYDYMYNDRGYYYNKDTKTQRICDFCGYEEDDDKLFNIVLPDGNEVYICSECFKDLEKEITRIRKEIDSKDPNKALEMTI